MAAKTFYKIENGKVVLDFGDHLGQTRAWESYARFVFVIAGTQSGKTSFGPWWLWREIKTCGNGDYLAATANYDLFKLKLLPEMENVFEGIFGWHYMRSDRVFESPDKVSLPNTPTRPAKRIILRSANAPGGLESASVEAVLLDECGHPDFKIDAWEAVQRRLSLSEGRVFAGTTPYNLGWLKTEVYDVWKAGSSEFDVIQFKSIMNPAFPKEEYERMRQKLPLWKFRMFYDGEFEKPAGIIYDCFIDALHICPRFPIPEAWPRYLGLDFGGVNTAGLFYAEEPKAQRLYLYRSYLEGGRTSVGHVRELLRGEPRIPYAAGGAPSEDAWRSEFKAAGLPVRRPDIKDVEVGIDRVYEAHKLNQIIVFEDQKGYLEEKHTYSRKLDKNGDPTEEIENKNAFHRMDCERYIISNWKRKLAGVQSKKVNFYAPRKRGVVIFEPARTEEEIERMLKEVSNE